MLSRADNALEAARLIASLRLSGVVVADDSGEPEAVLAGSQVLRIVVPKYVREDPRLAHVYDEAGADELCAKLSERTVADLLDHEDVEPASIPRVQPEDTLVEIAARLEVAASTVRRSLHGQGVVLRPPGRRRIA